jgi:hypothetical protein
LELNDSHSEYVPCDLHYLTKRASRQADRCREACRAFVPNDADFDSFSILHYDYQRNQTLIEKMDEP